MSTVIEVIHVMIALALIGFVLIQKSEGGGLGIGGGGMSGFMTGRGQANFLTRTTAILIGALVVTSLLLTWLHSMEHGKRPGILDRLPAATDTTKPVEKSAAPESPVAPAPKAADTAPAKPAEPAVPLAH